MVTTITTKMTDTSISVSVEETRKLGNGSMLQESGVSTSVPLLMIWEKEKNSQDYGAMSLNGLIKFFLLLDPT